MPGIQRLFSDLISERLISKAKCFRYFSVKLLFCMGDGKLQLCDPDHCYSSFAAQIPAPVFQISRYAIRAVHENKNAELSINFFPELNQKELEEYLEQRKTACPYKTEKELLIGLFPEKTVSEEKVESVEKPVTTTESEETPDEEIKAEETATEETSVQEELTDTRVVDIFAELNEEPVSEDAENDFEEK